MTVGRLLSSLDEIAPFEWAFSFDKVGLLIGKKEDYVSKVAVSLDASEAAVEFAISQGCQALVAHHPIIWDPLKTITTQNQVVKAVSAGLAVIGFHTNWDIAPGGINDTLAEKLGLTGVTPAGSKSPLARLKLVTYCPPSLVDAVLDAAAGAGAGVIGAYSRCAFKQEGKGTYLPSMKANPFLGLRGEVVEAEEVRVEMELSESNRSGVLDAVRSVHPYEEPVIEFYELQGVTTIGIGRIGDLAGSLTLAEFGYHIERSLGSRPLIYGDPNLRIDRVGVCGGAASDEWGQSQAAGADVLVTGEVRHNHGVEASEAGFALVQAGHYETEHPGMAALTDRLKESGWEAVLFEPEPGEGGRSWNGPVGAPL